MDGGIALRGKGRARRAVLGALVLAAGTASLLGSASPAAADSIRCQRNFQFTPLELRANDVEDWGWGANDEIQLNYPGHAFTATMYQYQAVVPPQSPPLSQNPGSTFRVYLYEWDGSSNRLLGSPAISWWDTGDAGSWVDIKVTGDYSYTLRYKVRDVGEGNCVLFKTVPDVVGQPAAQGVDILNDNFRLSYMRPVEDCNNPPTVVYQSPRSGELQQWSTVTVQLSQCSGNYN